MAPDITLSIAEVIRQLPTTTGTRPLREKIERQVAGRQSAGKNEPAVPVHRKTIVLSTQVERSGGRCLMTHGGYVKPALTLSHQTLFTRIRMTIDQHRSQQADGSRLI
jgi:hypothetical protein